MQFYLLSLWTKSCGVTVQLKSLQPSTFAQYHLCFNICKMKFGIFLEFGCTWPSWELKPVKPEATLYSAVVTRICIWKKGK